MASYSKGSVILIRYPFSDLTGSKVRPAVVVSSPHESNDLIFVPLTSRTSGLKSGEFLLSDFRGAGLHVPTAVKRGLYVIEERLALQSVGELSHPDLDEIEKSLIYWLGLTIR